MKKNYKDKRFKIINIYNRLKNATGLEGLELLHARKRTMNFLEDFMTSSDEETVIPEDKKFKEYRDALSKAYEKAAGGKTKSTMMPGPGGVPQELKSWDLDFNDPKVRKIKEDLDAKYKVAIDARKKDEEKYKKYLEEQEEVSLFYIPLKWAPTTQAQFDAVSDLLIMTTDPKIEEEWETLFQKMLNDEKK